MTNPLDEYLQSLESKRRSHGRDSFAQHMFETSQAAPTYVDDTTLIARVQPIVERINVGQRELERRQLETDSLGYYVLHNSLRALGIMKDPPLHDKDNYGIFSYQQQNVNELGGILIDLVLLSGKELQKTYAHLDTLFKEAAKSTLHAKYLHENIPDSMKTYDDLVDKIRNVDRHEDPEAYYKLMGATCSEKRKQRKEQFAFTICNESKMHYEAELEHFTLQEEIFETTVYCIIEIQMRTKLYQEALTRSLPIWQRIDNLSTVVGHLEDGVAILSEYNHNLNQSYIAAVEHIHKANASRSTEKPMHQMNSNLRSLLKNIRKHQNRSSNQYGQR